MSSRLLNRLWAVLAVFAVAITGFFVPVGSAAAGPGALGTLSLGGQAFGDADENGQYSPGEALSGVKVTLYSHQGWQEAVTADADGRFLFPGLAAGTYDVYAWQREEPDGWIVPTGVRTFVLDGSVEHTEVPIRALRPLSETLTATLKLDKEDYAPGDRAEVLITLANRGPRAITGIYAGCDRAGNERALDITPAGWGELAYGGAGATVRPGETRRFRVSGVVPEVLGSWGFVEQICTFSTSEEYVSGSPEPGDTAKVTGPAGSSKGRVVKENGEGLADQELRLTDIDSGKQLTARTDTTGAVTASGPAGRYRVKIIGPWTPAYGDVVYLVAPPVNRDGWVTTVRPC